MNDPRTRFGPAAESYLASAVHSNASALSRLVKVAKPAGGTVVDIATGAGHTAYAFSPYVDRVIATDITPDMLRVTRETALQRGLSNLSVLFAAAEELPFRDRSVDGLSCRLGAHHFQNVHSFVREAHRALTPGGWFLLVDSIGSEDADADALVDEFERVRDPSHVRNYKRSDWLNMIAEAGFQVRFEEVRAKEIDAEDWMDRIKVSDADRAYLREMMDKASGEFARYLSPDTKGGRAVFHLDEILLLANRP